jgi:hypothetical protein
MMTGPFNLPNYYGWPTTHGQINLNMVRHPQVLNALLDNDEFINDPRFFAPGTVTQFLDDATGDTYGTPPQPRQWWIEFIKSRDSRYNSTTPFPTDPVANLYVPIPYSASPTPTGGLFLPGTANARPFRSLDSVGTIPVNTTTYDSPIEDTILRSLPLEAAATTTPNQSRRLFEVGKNTGGATSDFYPFTTAAGVPPEDSNSPLHPTVRHQLLSKIMNNTTTRSNTFGVYVTIQYYEAVQVAGTSGTTSTAATATRIGGQLTDMPTNRAFFVIDRTGAIDQMKILEANGVNPVSPGSYSFQPNTDTSGLRANMNGIRWRDLVLYRQTLN